MLVVVVWCWWSLFGVGGCCLVLVVVVWCWWSLFGVGGYCLVLVVVVWCWWLLFGVGGRGDNSNGLVEVVVMLHIMQGRFWWLSDPL